MAKKQLVRKWNYIVTPKIAKWLYNSMNHRFNILEGQVRSGKDITGAVAMVEHIKISNENLFLIGAVSSDKAIRIVGQYIIDYCGGEAVKTKYNNADAIEFRHKGKINYIVFASGYNKNSEEFIQGDTYGGVYLTEINLLNKDFISQAIKRMASVDNPFLIGTLNPKGPKHWFYKEFLDVWEEEQLTTPDKDWLNYEHLAMADNPIMTEEKLEDAKRGIDPNSVKYKRDILGLRVDPEGALYTIREENIIKNINYKKYSKYIVVTDVGESKSATVFMAIGITHNNELGQKEAHVLKMYHHMNDDFNDLQKKHLTDYANDNANFILECIDLFGRYPDKVLFDGTKQYFRDLKTALIKNRIGHIVPKFVPKDDEKERIPRLQSLIYQLKIRINKNLTKAIDDLRNAEYDDKKYDRTGKIETKKIFTERGHLDTIDCIAYATLWYKNELK
jgi:PBSX family phage terminase large subunit